MRLVLSEVNDRYSQISMWQDSPKEFKIVKKLRPTNEQWFKKIPTIEIVLREVKKTLSVRIENSRL